MHDIKWIREHPEAFDAALKRRGLEGVSSEILTLDKQRREAQTQLNDLQSRRNQASKAIGAAKKQRDDAKAEAMMAEVARIKEHMAQLEEELALDRVGLRLQHLPNLLADDVPDGANENANVESHRRGEPPVFDFEALDHVAIGEALGGMDFETAAKMAGSRFVLLSGPLARLERALAQFMLDVHTGEHGYTECAPPFLVKDHTLFGTGQLPKFADDLYQTSGDHWLIPTAEVSLTNIVADEMLAEAYLPRRYTAHTPCFRSEAGAAGKDTRGMIRQHQFAKVELVSITHPDDSEAEHERMTRCAETVLERLGLPYRRMLLCAGDTGFAARKTYDLEVWLPGQQAYREISSCSNCGDFQARRMNARFRPRPLPDSSPEEEGKQAQPAGGGEKPRFVHTLNGSGVAVGRALIAILEHYQQQDGSVVVPEVLRGYMDGVEKIEVTKRRTHENTNKNS